MSYDFSLDKKKVILVSVIAIFLVFLIFMAGWTAGIMANISSLEKQKSMPSRHKYAGISLPAVKPEAAPQKPIPPEQQTPLQQETKQPGKPASSLESAQKGAAAPEAQMPIKGKPEPKKTPAVTKDAPPSPTPKDVQGSPKSKESLPAGPSKGSSTSAEAAKKRESTHQPVIRAKVFTVQVESAIVRQNALRTANKLKEKGYEVLILKKYGPVNKTWYAVQFGEYQDRGEASRAASWFTEKEKIVAVVMPLVPYQLKERKSPESFAQPQ